MGLSVVTGLIGSAGTKFDGAMKLTAGTVAREGAYSRRMEPDASFFVAGTVYRPTNATTAISFGLETEDDLGGSVTTALYAIPLPTAGVYTPFKGVITVDANATRGRSYATCVGGEAQFAELSISPYGAVAQLDLVERHHIAPDTLAGDAIRLVVEAGKPSVSSGAVISVTADLIPMYSVAGDMLVETGFSHTATNGGVSNLTGLGFPDTGVQAAGEYHVYAISDGVTPGLTFSLSSTAPTLPSGYTFFARLGSVLSKGSNLFLHTLQTGKRARIVNDGTGLPVMVSGRVVSGVTTSPGDHGVPVGPTWGVVTVSGVFVPSTAKTIALSFYTSGTSVAQVAPSTNYGAFNDPTNGPYASGSGNTMTPVLMPLEGGTICWAASNSASVLWCSGWEDNVAA